MLRSTLSKPKELNSASTFATSQTPSPAQKEVVNSNQTFSIAYKNFIIIIMSSSNGLAASFAAPSAAPTTTSAPPPPSGPSAVPSTSQLPSAAATNPTIDAAAAASRTKRHQMVVGPQQASFLLGLTPVIEPLLPRGNLKDQLSRLAAGGPSAGVPAPSVIPREEFPEDWQPQGLKSSLFPHQRAGVSFLWHLHRNGMAAFLADEMGLGKTITTLAFLQHVEEKVVGFGSHLIVVPLSTLSNWEAENDKFTSLTLCRFHGNKDQRSALKKVIKRTTPHIVLTTYETLAQEPAFFQGVAWHFIILDEGHRAKNAATSTWTIVRKLKSENRLCITGTPIQNNLVELW